MQISKSSKQFRKGVPISRAQACNLTEVQTTMECLYPIFHSLWFRKSLPLAGGFI